MSTLFGQVRRAFHRFFCVLFFFAFLLTSARGGTVLWLEAEDFQYFGDWVRDDDKRGCSGGNFLFSGNEKASLPAATVIEIPGSGRYFLWGRALDFPEDSPGVRRCVVSVNGVQAGEPFGDSGRSGWAWERGGGFELAKGSALIAIEDTGSPYTRFDALVLTDDPDYEPEGIASEAGATLAIPLAVVAEKGPEMQESPDPIRTLKIEDIQPEVLASVENGNARIFFVSARSEGRDIVVPRFEVKKDGVWMTAPADASVEAYVVVKDRLDSVLRDRRPYPGWSGRAHPLTLRVGQASVQTSSDRREAAIWRAGTATERFLPREAQVADGGVWLTFYPSSLGELTAIWRLESGEKAARVTLEFVPREEGQYSLGYHVPCRKGRDDVDEILLPMMFHRKRIPEEPYTLLQPNTPTPLSLVQIGGPETPFAWAVIGDPSEVPYEWPDRSNPYYGFTIRDEAGQVQPAIYGPVVGTREAVMKAGEGRSFSFRVLAQTGDWYAGYRTAADEVFGLKDYRRNVGVSLTDAALNMMDLVMDDTYGGWWERAKAFYQVESRNGSTQAAPLMLLSLYCLTGDEEVYRRRALPTMEFVISRSSAHFSPVPSDTGSYSAGGMDGPAKLFGSTTYGGFWRMTQGYTPAFEQIAFPEGEVRATVGYTHAGEFEEYLTRYRLQGDPQYLARAVGLADEYLARDLYTPPETPLGAGPFFLIHFVPNWEGLLRMYEATGEKRFLEGAVLGARQLMTGLWTQPVIPPGEMTVHPTGEFPGQGPTSLYHKGPEMFRLGFPRQIGDTSSHVVPAWLLSNVGLGFEQPSTYGYLIYEAVWAPNFLLLGRHTGDRDFETCARNGTLGRWGNYPGYCANGFTDLPLNPRYPYEGPDVTVIYYHHIAPHLAWTIDYLVADAELLSDGRISFPYERQTGYAYFDSRVFGHAPGRVYGDENVWLWLRRGLVDLDNVQVNYLTAHDEKRFYAILMNQSRESEKVRVRFLADALGYDPEKIDEVRIVGGSGVGDSVSLRVGMAEVELPARGIVVLALEGTDIQVPVHRLTPKPVSGAEAGYAKSEIGDSGLGMRAVAIQIAPGGYDAFVWCTAQPDEARVVVLEYRSGAESFRMEDTEFPYEFSIPVGDAETVFEFEMEVETTEGKTVRSRKMRIKGLGPAGAR
ncbi:hypothetical protein HQ520_18350 [bacterium]|nr:hypothetical protein [bacterium]